MASYCTHSDIYAALPSVAVESSGTVPTETQLDAMIVDVSAEIDGVLRSRSYTLPISDADSLAYLKTVCVYGTAAMMLQAKFMEDGSEGGAEFWETRYRKALDDIRSGAVVVPDADIDSVSFGEGFTADADGDAYEPFATRDMEF
jgi:phage gp36-like protein